MFAERPSELLGRFQVPDVGNSTEAPNLTDLQTVLPGQLRE